MSDIRHTTQTAFQRRFLKVEEADLTERLNALKDELDQALERDGIALEDRRFRFLADMRCSGQFHELLVPLSEPGVAGWWQPGAVATAFHDHHEQAYGHTDPDAPVEFVNLRVEGFGRNGKGCIAAGRGTSVRRTRNLPRARSVCLDADEGFHDTPVYRREDLEPGHVVAGPAVIIQRDTTTVVLAGQKATVAPGQVIRIGAARERHRPHHA